MDKLPYVLGRVELVEQPGLTMISNIVDCPEDDLRTDMRLEVVFREIGSSQLILPLFRPRSG
jgi:uncharacterized OB-fold protein